MKRSVAIAILVFLVFCGWVLAKDKAINWQDGQVTEIASETIGQGGIHQVGGTVIGSGSGNIWRDKGVTYTIKAADITYTASEFSMAHHKLKPERVKVGPVKFFLQGEKQMVILGDDGKHYKLDITKRAHQ